MTEQRGKGALGCRALQNLSSPFGQGAIYQPQANGNVQALTCLSAVRPSEGWGPLRSLSLAGRALAPGSA